MNLQKQRYEYFSPACITMYGYSPQEMIAMSEHETRSHVHPHDLPVFDAEMARIREKGDGGYEVRWIKSSGECRWISVQIHLTKDTNGVPLYRDGFVRDVTENKKAEEALQKSERQYNTLFNTMTEGFSIDEIIFDETGKPVDLRYLKVNPAFERINKLKAEDIIGRTTLELFPDAEPIWFERYGNVVLTGEPYHFEERFGPLDKWYDVLAYKTGPTEFAVIFFDITERKRAENELKEALAEKEVLLSEIHHRVKNNLTAFISLLSLDGSYENTESGRTLRNDLQNRARSMALIHETLYRTGKFSNVDMSIYLKNLVDQIAQSYGTRSDIKISVEVDGTLSIDRATTAGLIINELVTNSFKYAFPPEFDSMAVRGVPCSIRVSLAREGGTEVLRVSDNGCGFREGFDPLTSKSLGLKLVNFLSHHQLMADIEIRSDKGTEFIFRLKNTENRT
jgi:PAS domain S-box-containing protein